MDGDRVSVPLYRRFKPQGKVRRRVQDLRTASASYTDFVAAGHRLDLSHNESARMAVDSLLSRGLKEYHQVLRAEGEVDFLSQPEKAYMLENARAGSAAASSTFDDQLESSCTDSQLDSQCPAPSADRGPSAAEDQSCQRGVSNCVQVKPSFEVYFQSHCGAAGMKDLTREFMRKATKTLAVVMDSFSDVELLCDLLEASRIRSVSVYLLLDHLNLSLFVNMWQELQLNSKNFPKLSVRSVQGQTYCARTGTKLTGQITESFIITDWTEVLTGSFSFSWLSWQVHRSLAVLVKGSAVPPFHAEFLRLNSCSQTVAGFVSYTAERHALPLSNKTLHAPQNGDTFASGAKPAPSKLSRVEDKKAEAKAKVQFFSSLQSNRGKEGTQPAGGAVSPKSPRNAPACKSETAGGAVYTCHRAQRKGALDEGGNQVQNHLSPLGPAHISQVESQLSGLTVSPAAPESFPTQRRGRTVRYRAAQPNQDYGLFFQHNEKGRSAKPLGSAVHRQNKQQWFNTQNFRGKTEFLSPCPKRPSSSTPQGGGFKKDLLLPLNRPRGLGCGLQGRKSCLPTTQRFTTSGLASELKAQSRDGSRFLSPGAKPDQEAPPGLNWKSPNPAASPKRGARRSFLDSLYRPVWRPFHSSGVASLQRSTRFTQTPIRLPKDSSADRCLQELRGSGRF